MRQAVVSFYGFPSLYVRMTPELERAMEEADELYDWQPIIDQLYFDLENHFMENFEIDEVKVIE